MSADESPLTYRLITGPDDKSFCKRISEALAEGYVLHGGPAVTFNGTSVICAQALILPQAIAISDAAVATALDELDAELEFDGEGIA